MIILHFRYSLQGEVGNIHLVIIIVMKQNELILIKMQRPKAMGVEWENLPQGPIPRVQHQDSISATISYKQSIMDWGVGHATRVTPLPTQLTLHLPNCSPTLYRNSMNITKVTECNKTMPWDVAHAILVSHLCVNDPLHSEWSSGAVQQVKGGRMPGATHKHLPWLTMTHATRLKLAIRKRGQTLPTLNIKQFNGSTLLTTKNQFIFCWSQKTFGTRIMSLTHWYGLV